MLLINNLLSAFYVGLLSFVVWYRLWSIDDVILFGIAAGRPSTSIVLFFTYLNKKHNAELVNDPTDPVIDMNMFQNKIGPRQFMPLAMTLTQKKWSHLIPQNLEEREWRCNALSKVIMLVIPSLEDHELDFLSSFRVP